MVEQRQKSSLSNSEHEFLTTRRCTAFSQVGNPFGFETRKRNNCWLSWSIGGDYGQEEETGPRHCCHWLPLFCYTCQLWCPQSSCCTSHILSSNLHCIFPSFIWGVKLLVSRGIHLGLWQCSVALATWQNYGMAVATEEQNPCCWKLHSLVTF